jgi:hypothetical protein
MLHDIVLFLAGMLTGAVALAAGIVLIFVAIDRLGDDHEWVGL